MVATKSFTKLQDFKQYIYLIRMKTMSRMQTPENNDLLVQFNRLLKISDFLFCNIEKFNIDELQDICKIFATADIAHEPEYSGKTKEQVESDRKIFEKLLVQTENYLHDFHELDIKNSSPSDMIIRNKLQLYRLEEIIGKNIIKFNEYIKFYSESPQPDYQLTAIKCEYETQVEKLTKLLESCKLIKEDLENINRPNIDEISSIEKKIKMISDLEKDIVNLLKVEQIEVLLKEAELVDKKVDKFILSV